MNEVRKKLNALYVEYNIRDVAYSFLTGFFFILAGLIFFSLIVFVTKNVNLVVGQSIAEDKAPAEFDIKTFADIAPRLGITFDPGASAAVSAPKPTESSPQAAAVPQPETPTFDITPLSIQVLNGTTISGLAKTWQGYLEAEGFKNLTIGNASKRTYTGATIQYKVSAVEALPILKAILTERGLSVSREEEQNSISFDIVLIIGK